MQYICKYIGYSCLKNYCWHILYTLAILCHKYFFYKHAIVVNMYVSLYNNMSQPITSGNTHAQIDKCAYARNHGHNNMGCGHAPHGGTCPHMGIPLHFQTYLFFMVATVVTLLATHQHTNTR